MGKFIFKFEMVWVQLLKLLVLKKKKTDSCPFEWPYLSCK